MKKILLTSILLYVSFSLTFAQEQKPDKDTVFVLSPIVVNPTMAKERETPVTFSNLDQKQINERYTVQDIPVMLSELPSATYYSENGNGIGYNYINLRGFDQRRLSIMVNGIPQNDPEDHNVYWIDFPDLLASAGEIQVQRGAGSAFYGPPAIGGSINLETTPFSMERGIRVETMLGFQESGEVNNQTKLNTRKSDVSINSGLIENRYLFYGRLGKITSDGYRDNSWVELNSYFLGAVRFDKNMTTRVHFFGGPLNDGLAYVGIPKYYNSDKDLRRINYSYWEPDSTGNAVGYSVLQKPQSTESFSQPHYELLHEWRLSSSVTLFNTFFLYTGEGYFDYDGDWVPYTSSATSWFQNFAEYDSTFGTSLFPSLILRGFVGNKQWGWLPRVEIQHENGNLTVGGELRIHRSTHWGKIAYASQYPSFSYDPDFHFYEYNGEKDILSFYGHELYKINDDWNAMLDLQFVHNRYGIANEKFLGNNFSHPYTFLNPRFGLNYNIDSSWNTYVSLAYTSREPRLKNLYSAEEAWTGETPQFTIAANGSAVQYDYSNPLVKPERLLDIEIGGSYHDSLGRISGNLYWMEFTDELVKSGQIDIFGAPITGNAERTRHIGLEIDGSMQMNKEISLSGNITFSQNKLVKHTTYVTLSDTNNNSYVVAQNLDDNPVAGFPDILWNLRLTYHYKHVTSSLVAKYVGSFYTDNFKLDANKNDEYTILNLEFLYKSPRIFGMNFTLRGEVNNLLGKLYTMYGEGNAFFPAAERNFLIGVAANF